MNDPIAISPRLGKVKVGRAIDLVSPMTEGKEKGTLESNLKKCGLDLKAGR